MAPPGQIKTLSPLIFTHTHKHRHTNSLTVLSAAPADLSTAYKDNSCSTSTDTVTTNDNNGLRKTIVNDKKGVKVCEGLNHDLNSKHKEGNTSFAVTECLYCFVQLILMKRELKCLFFSCDNSEYST